MFSKLRPKKLPRLLQLSCVAEVQNLQATIATPQKYDIKQQNNLMKHNCGGLLKDEEDHARRTMPRGINPIGQTLLLAFLGTQGL